MCEVSHRSNIALHCSKSKRFFAAHASYASGSGLKAFAAAQGRPPAHLAELDKYIAARKKEAARRRP
jgi:hypothetical protein